MMVILYSISGVLCILSKRIPASLIYPIRLECGNCPNRDFRLLEDGIAVQSPGHCHVNTMCGDGKSEPCNYTIQKASSLHGVYQYRKSAHSTGLRGYMSVQLVR